ncbi:MAG: hypothetical protein IKH26_08325 [Bacteroidaceae bacterium]|nr:hypothetical protein [Bacteroidaceae bacterium]
MLVNNALFRRIELQQLMNLTARAFGKPSQRIWTLPNDEALRVYAEYTRDHLQEGVNGPLLERMNGEAYKMGRWLRRLFFLNRQADIERFTIALYRNIGIELEGSIPGQLCFRRCFFSHYYTPDICLAASALDDGMIRGLAGKGRLTFQKRITEGCKCCIATFHDAETTE